MLPDPLPRERLLNDVHSRLNATPVRLLTPATVPDAAEMVRACARAGRSLIAAGARHAMGGQQLLSHGLVLDTSALDRVLAFDAERGLLTVEAGIRWPALLDWLRRHPRNARGWTIRQKQTGADDFSLGGAFAANVHGRSLRYAPFVEDVESVRLIDAAGRSVHASREQNPHLFALAAGGYGLFGLVVQLTLRLTPRQVLQRRVHLLRVAGLAQAFEQAIAAGACHGDFQFAIDPASDDFLDLGVLSCYHPAPGQPIDAPSHLNTADFAALLLSAHTAPSRAFDAYAAFYLGTDGQRYHCDSQQSGVDLGDYHGAVHRALGHRGSEMITELYVPRACLAGFMARAAASLRRRAAQPIYGTVRLVEADPTSVLCWARQDWACIVFNLHVRHDPAGIAAAREAFRALIDDALHFGGSYYLTYHRWATTDQLQAAYPRIDAFIAAQREFDPQGRWRSDWYRHIAALRS